MARRKADGPIQKVTLNLFVGDYERVQRLFPKKGAAWAIRDMVHKYLKVIEAKMKEKAVPVEDLDIDKLMEE